MVFMPAPKLQHCIEHFPAVHVSWCSVCLRITAYVVKVFSMAHSFISVSEKRLCGPLLYLLKNKQRPDGSFQENNPVYDTSMTVRINTCDCTSFIIIYKRLSECFLTVLTHVLWCREACKALNPECLWPHSCSLLWQRHKMLLPAKSQTSTYR